MMNKSVFFVLSTSESLKLSGFNKFLSKETTTLTLAALLVFSMLSSIPLTSYNLRLKESVLTAQSLQIEYIHRTRARLKIDGPIQYEGVANKMELSRLIALINARTGLELDLSDWDTSYQIIDSYLDSLGKR